MKVELIPVIEIGYNNQGVPAPENYQYWNYTESWDAFNNESYSKAGFKDVFKPYLPGFSLYKLNEITEDNLIKIVKDHTEDFRLGKYERQQSSPLFGGYVLRINEEDKYFPQCCGDLSDIHYWEKLSNNENHVSYEGHPAPFVKIDSESIYLDFTTDEFDEQFIPPPPEIKLKVDKESLKKAIETAKEALRIFSERLNEINSKENLNISEIDKLLIWGDYSNWNVV